MKEFTEFDLAIEKYEDDYAGRLNAAVTELERIERDLLQAEALFNRCLELQLDAEQRDKVVEMLFRVNCARRCVT